MTNRETIEQWIGTNGDIIDFHYQSDLNDEVFFYVLTFSESASDYTGTYDITINADGSITHLPHLR